VNARVQAEQQHTGRGQIEHDGEGQGIAPEGDPQQAPEPARGHARSLRARPA
jgi:hypothetical protein